MGVHKSYEGETCRNSYIRGSEHLKQLNNKCEKSALYKHVKEDHSGEENLVNFSMKITGRFKQPLFRQIDEANRIRRMNPKNLLNSKMEYFGPVIPRKVIERRNGA